MVNVATNRAMQTFGMMQNLSVDQEKALRTELAAFMADQTETDELKLTIAALQFLRGRQPGLAAAL